MIKPSTKTRIVSEGHALLQRFGFNGFSFQHIADRLGMKKPSLYDHFESKEALGNELIDRYREVFIAWAERASGESPSERLEKLFAMFSRFCREQHKMCPVTALSADMNTLPKSMRKNLESMAECYESWMETVIREGIRRGEFATKADPKALATVVLSIALGSQHLARMRHKPELFEEIVLGQVLQLLGAKKPRAKASKVTKR